MQAVFQRDDDDVVAHLDLVAAAGDEDVVAAGDAAEQQILFQMQLAQRHAGGPALLMDSEFQRFWVYPQTGEVFPFAFFLFFGFFGFFFEGKMSHTLMDERYTENRAKAQLTAAKTALSIIFVAVILLAQGRGGDAVLIALLIVLSLTLALYLFLSEYLLYRYDHDDLPAEDFDESED